MGVQKMDLRWLVFCFLPFLITAQNTKSSWPWSDLDDVDYILSTFGNENFYFKIPISGQELLDHGFNPSNPTAFVVHGWVQSGESYCNEFLDAYHNDMNDQYNVICVDWDQLASIDNYLGAAYSSNSVGAHVGANLTVKILFEELGQNPAQIYASGHSLGAHLVGHLGRAVQNAGYGKIARVTGLDPARPVFDMVGMEWRLQPTDAEFVDVIHTNSGLLWDGCVSMPWQVGQIDFYPNGGAHQAGCTDLCIGDACIGFDLIDFFKAACSHKRAHYLFVESIENRANPDYFQSVACSDYDAFVSGQCAGENALRLPMGMGLSPQMWDGESRTFFLDTKDSYPYSLSN